jgi:hypothetical protein
MVFKKRQAKRARRDEAASSADATGFSHASGADDLAGLLGQHTLSPEQEKAIPPKGYRSRSIAKIESHTTRR